MQHQSAIGIEHLQTATAHASSGKPYNPVITINNVRYSFYNPPLADVDAVARILFNTKAFISTDATPQDIMSFFIACGDLFTDIHLRMEMQEIGNPGNPGKRPVQKPDLDLLHNQAHVLLFRNVYMSLCVFFILKSEGYTITF